MPQSDSKNNVDVQAAWVLFLHFFFLILFVIGVLYAYRSFDDAEFPDLTRPDYAEEKMAIQRYFNDGVVERHGFLIYPNPRTPDKLNFDIYTHDALSIVKHFAPNGVDFLTELPFIFHTFPRKAELKYRQAYHAKSGTHAKNAVLITVYSVLDFPFPDELNLYAIYARWWEPGGVQVIKQFFSQAETVLDNLKLPPEDEDGSASYPQDALVFLPNFEFD